ncbi:MAG: hypothetical protein CTY20_14380 [Hyphomicrobium sp.]|nr:MAG: hypothetical protein CTY20_14380 [Hyphomicrobium sp.]
MPGNGKDQTNFTRIATIGAATLVIVLATASGLSRPAKAERIDNQVAVFSALDKVTARISKLEAPLGETVQFGALKVTARTCYSRPPTEQPKTTTFVEVDEIQLDGTQKRVFAGWMFAESPGLNAVEHPVFDVWLTECQKPAKSVAQRPVAIPGQAPPGQAAQGAAQQPGAQDPAEPRRRVRR